MPPIPPMPPISGIAGASDLGRSATIASVVIIKPAIDAAACSELRVTLAGSIIPISIMSPYSPVESEEHTSELQSRPHLVCRLLLEKKKEKPLPRRSKLLG